MAGVSDLSILIASTSAVIPLALAGTEVPLGPGSYTVEPVPQLGHTVAAPSPVVEPGTPPLKAAPTSSGRRATEGGPPVPLSEARKPPAAVARPGRAPKRIMIGRQRTGPEKAKAAPPPAPAAVTRSPFGGLGPRSPRRKKAETPGRAITAAEARPAAAPQHLFTGAAAGKKRPDGAAQVVPRASIGAVARARSKGAEVGSPRGAGRQRALRKPTPQVAERVAPGPPPQRLDGPRGHPPLGASGRSRHSAPTRRALAPHPLGGRVSADTPDG